MLRHIAQPLHARRLQPDVRIEAARDGAVDHGLLLLVQQRDQLLLGADVAPDPPVGVVEEADDGGLFVEGRQAQSQIGSNCRASRIADTPLTRRWSADVMSCEPQQAWTPIAELRTQLSRVLVDSQAGLDKLP